MKNNIVQHFRKDESSFIKLAMNWIQHAIDEYRPILTILLNPRQQYILTTLVNRFDGIKLGLNGGYLSAEMKRGLIYPDYYEKKDEDYNLSLFEINYSDKFTKLNHSQILGTLIGSGVERGVIGDIITDANRWQFVIDNGMGDYVNLQIDRIGKDKVHLELLPFDQIISPITAWIGHETTLSTTRLDNVLADAFKLSRHKAKDLIDAKRIKLNWMNFDRANYQLEIADVISARGYGRVRLDDVEGITRHGKLHVVLSILYK